jgi:hypothetical protein
MKKIKSICAMIVVMLVGNSVFAADAVSNGKNASTSEPIVKVYVYSTDLINRTEYALTIKSADFGTLPVNDVLQNENKNLQSDSKSFVIQTLQLLKQNNTKSLINSTLSQIVKDNGKAKMTSKYTSLSKYFKDFKDINLDDGFTVMLADKSIVFVESFTAKNGNVKMFGMLIGKDGNTYKISEVFPGETSILVAYPPEQNKKPIIVANSASGFKRNDLTEIGADALVPAGWFFRHENNNGTQAYFISKEEIKGDDGIFETGLP